MVKRAHLIILSRIFIGLLVIVAVSGAYANELVASRNADMSGSSYTNPLYAQTDDPPPSEEPPEFHDIQVVQFFGWAAAPPWVFHPIPRIRDQRLPLKVRVRNNSAHQDTATLALTANAAANSNCTAAVAPPANVQLNIPAGQHRDVIFTVILRCNGNPRLITDAFLFDAVATHVGAADSVPANNMLSAFVNARVIR